MAKTPIAMFRIENAHDLLDAINAINGNSDILCTGITDAQGNDLDMFRVWEETLSDGSTVKSIELFTSTPQVFWKTKTAYEVAQGAAADPGSPRRRRRKGKAAGAK